MKMRFLILICVFFFTGAHTYAQKAPAKFGVIRASDFEVALPATDTSAAAVVIFDLANLM